MIDVKHMQSPLIVNMCELQSAVLCSTRTEQPTQYYYMMPSDTAEVANTVGKAMVQHVKPCQYARSIG